MDKNISIQNIISHCNKYSDEDYYRMLTEQIIYPDSIACYMPGTGGDDLLLKRDPHQPYVFPLGSNNYHLRLYGNAFTSTTIPLLADFQILDGGYNPIADTPTTLRTATPTDVFCSHGDAYLGDVSSVRVYSRMVEINVVSEYSAKKGNAFIAYGVTSTPTPAIPFQIESITVETVKSKRLHYQFDLQEVGAIKVVVPSSPYLKGRMKVGESPFTGKEIPFVDIVLSQVPSNSSIVVSTTTLFESKVKGTDPAVYASQAYCRAEKLDYASIYSYLMNYRSSELVSVGKVTTVSSSNTIKGRPIPLNKLRPIRKKGDRYYENNHKGDGYDSDDYGKTPFISSPKKKFNDYKQDLFDYQVNQINPGELGNYDLDDDPASIVNEHVNRGNLFVNAGKLLAATVPILGSLGLGSK